MNGYTNGAAINGYLNGGANNGNNNGAGNMNGNGNVNGGASNSTPDLAEPAEGQFPFYEALREVLAEIYEDAFENERDGDPMTGYNVSFIQGRLNRDITGVACTVAQLFYEVYLGPHRNRYTRKRPYLATERRPIEDPDSWPAVPETREGRRLRLERRRRAAQRANLTQTGDGTQNGNGVQNGNGSV